VTAAAVILAVALVGLFSSPTPSLHTYTAGSLTATAWLLTWRYRSTELTWVGSTFLLLGLLHLLGWAADLTVPHLLTMTLLLHASLVLSAALLVRAIRREGEIALALRRLYGGPLSRAALVSTFVALPLVLLLDEGSLELRSVSMGWLAAIWLVISWAEVSRWLFAGCQAALCVTVGLAVTAWLEGQPWVVDNPDAGLWDPLSLQAYGLGLAGLCLAWVAARILLQANPTARELLLPDWPGVDRIVLGTLLLGQIGLADWGVLPGILRELTPAGYMPPLEYWPPQYIYAGAYAPSAWLLVGALLLIMLASLWQPAPCRRQTEALLGLAVLAVTVPTLWAGRLRPEQAVASGLRWGLAVAFLAGSALLWLRGPVASLASGLRMPCPFEAGSAGRVRRSLLDLALVPVLLLTGAVAILAFAGTPPTGPSQDSLFGRMGATLSVMVPLGILSLTLVGHALRERSAGYAFAAGLLVNVIVMGGYALGVVTSGGALGTVEWVRLLQLGTITAAVWALLWLASRRWVAAWRDVAAAALPLALPRRLMAVQLGMGVVGIGVLLITAFALLALVTVDSSGPADANAAALAWVTETGSLLGWLAFGLVVCSYRAGRQRFLAEGPYLLGEAGVILIGCTIERVLPGWGFRALLAGWSACTLAWALRPWRASWRPADRADREAAGWVARTGIWVAVLGVLAAVFQEDYLWAAAAIGTASAGACLVAARQRRGTWALTAGLGFNLAAALVVWQFEAEVTLGQWWVRLVQVNGIVSAIVALVWLRLRPRLYDPATLTWSIRSMLTVQVALALLANAIVLVIAFLEVYVYPQGPLSLAVLQTGESAGWLALILATASAIWLARQAAPRGAVHVLGGCGIMFAVLLAATASTWGGGSWLAYHVLLVGLTALAAALLAGGWAGSEVRLLGPVFWPVERRERSARLLGDLFPASTTQRWVEGLGIVLVGLALRAGIADPGAPYWPAGAALAASLLAGGLAFWSGRPHYIHISGGLVFLAGVLTWVAWGRGELETFLYACILCLGIASAVWSVLEVRLRREWVAPAGGAASWSVGSVGIVLGLILLIVLFGPRALSSRLLMAPGGAIVGGLLLPATCFVGILLLRLAHLDERRAQHTEEELEVQEGSAWQLPFSQAAGLLGLNLLAILVGLGLGADLTQSAIHLAGPLRWIAWAVTLMAGVARLWDEEGLRGLRTLPLYVLGLLGIGLALHSLALDPAELCWGLALALAGYVLVTTLAARTVPRLGRLWQRLRLPARSGQGLEGWLLPLQAGLTGLVVLLSVWISFGFAWRLDRLAGPLATALLVPAWVLWTRLREQGIAPRPLSLAGLRYGTLLLGVVCAADLAWAIPDPAAAGAWLHRNVLLFAALALVATAYGLGLRKLLPRQERWAEYGERLGPRLGLTAVLVVLVVLGQELVLYEPEQKMAPMAPWAVALMVLTLIGLAGAGICFAVLPRVDPLALAERRRPLYVYAAELVLVLLFLHARLTMPFLFGGLLARYWTFVVMFLAFLGVGLAELFQRRGLRVLAEPLQRTGVFLPLLPLVAFWLPALAEPVYHGAGQEVRGLQPFLKSVMNLPRAFDEYSVLWFLLGLLYVLVAVSRRSFHFALLAAVAGNFALWALLYHYRDYGLGFLAHPQLWLIPLALIILVAEYLNRDRLPEAQATALRYFGLIVLYLSSTADLFIAGLGDVGLSLVLAVLAVLGVLAGIQLRVRAFLFLGLTFLVLVICARIWHAAVTQAQTWVWWVALIVLGAAILTLFAIFEKRRNDVLKMLEELKRWR
jgi:hypothetical protein